MRTPREIYTEFKIMPNLQLHQLRVAAVGKLICDSFTQPINTRDVVLACLFHDMGNILKFDLTKFPESTKPEGVEYWERVKSEFNKYGPEQHAATIAIAKEIGLPSAVVELLLATGFANIPSVASSRSMELKVVQYGDMRVGPFGILSLKDRLDDFSKRYGAKKDQMSVNAEQGGKDLEGQIFSVVAIKPEDITDVAIAPVVEELWEYPVA